LPTCAECSTSFTTISYEEVLRSKLGVPPARLCPDCRAQRRRAAINQVHLFKRSCDATGASIISNFPSDAPCPIYSQKYWYGDGWDAKSYGREFDFSRPFFEQFSELQRAVPRPALFTDFLRDENSAYTNFAAGDKNCYLIFQSGYCQDCYYSYFIENSKQVVDSYYAIKCELGYELLNCVNCYNSAFLTDCEGCSDSAFLQSCVGCKKSLMCVNLRHKELYVLNRPVSEQEYLQYREKLKSRQGLKEMQQKLAELTANQPRRWMSGILNDEVSGDYLNECRHTYNSFDSTGIDHGAYLAQCFKPGRDFLDCDGCGEGELLFESQQSGLRGYNLRVTQQCIEAVRDLTYCDICLNSSNCFGCVGLRRAEFCIFNRQYSKNDYELLTAKIINHMQASNEWGEYFPIRLSLSPYNLSLAQLRDPLTAQEAQAKGYSWFEKPKRHDPKAKLAPQSLEATAATLPQEVLTCSSCSETYKIIEPEYNFLISLKIAPPTECFLCRHTRRLNARTPQRLIQRKCTACQVILQTALTQKVAPHVLCLQCYQKEVM